MLNFVRFIMIITILIISFFSFLSCNHRADFDIREFKETNTFRLNLDNFTSPVEEFIQYVPDWGNREAIAFHVRKKNEIKIYDLQTGELTESLRYPGEGPDSFQGIYDFHILNRDTIFLNKRYLYKMYQVNKDLKKVQEYSFLGENEKIDPNSGIPLSGDSFLAIFSHNEIFKKIGDRIFLNGVPDKNADHKSSYDVDCLIVSVDLESKEIERLLGYPKKLQNNSWGVFHANLYADHSKKTNKFYLSYAADDEIYITNSDLDVLKSFRASPDKFVTISPLPAQARNNDIAYLDYYTKQFVFGSILYDEYRNLIYRIVLEPNPEYGDVFLKDPLYKPRNMVVMAFDGTNYNKITEMRLVQSDKGVYLDRCFVNEKGLNIAYVDLGNEDKLYFKTFALE